ncbi:MAG: MAPEG family protein [Rubrivivax sp.]|nr:MAPEG family protein [Rubrivivax sp.]
MNSISNSPGFLPFALAAVVLCINLLWLWAHSGSARNTAKATPNAEDAALFGGTLADIDPPPIARVLRAHANAQASIYPFLVLGALYLAAEGGRLPALIYCSVFCAARVIHSFAYLAGRQPWRTIAFVTGFAATGVLMVHVLWLLLAPK